jgi:hypothetical protein
MPYSEQKDSDVRVELWTFARGDRVRATGVGPNQDRFGKVISVHGCSVANTDEWCRDHCKNVYVMGNEQPPVTIEFGGEMWAIERARDFMIEPGNLEHCD